MKTKPKKFKEQAPPAPQPKTAQPQAAAVARWFSLAVGVFLGVCILKFGNPAIMERWVEPPTNIFEFLFGYPWPLRWAYWLLGAVALLGAFALKWRTESPLALLLLPLIWVVWQLLSAIHTVDAGLTRSTVPHLAACALCFYLGSFVLTRVPRGGLLWIGLLAGFVLMGVSAWSQRFGGLEETRKYFWTYVYPNLDAYPTDYIRKISSNRVFGTLFYPNTLAAGIILLFPPLTAKIAEWTGGGRFTVPARGFILSLWAVLSLGCLFWSGSKAGWLVMMLVVLVAFFSWRGIPARTRALAAGALIILGLGGFFWTYSGFFKRGAPSVGARFDYWQAAIKVVNQHPVYGSGPGTFAVPYKQIKAEESEMSRLVHNDYLQQASDSGIPGFLLYTTFVVWALWLGARRSWGLDSWDSPKLLRLCLWLGLAGWFVHSIVDFHLYIPALSWTAFMLTGWMIASGSASAEALSGAES